MENNLAMSGDLRVKAMSPINIALIKYWGKINEEYIIPANSSLSITLDINQMNSITEVQLLDDQE